MDQSRISPELVLVAPPELAAAARRELAERPWERQAPVRAASAPPRAPERHGRRVLLTAGAVALVVATTLAFSGALHRPVAATPRPQPGGGYVASAGALRASFRVDPSGARLVSLEAATRCGQVELADVPLSGGGGFSYSGSGSLRIELTGSFTGPGAARADLRVARSGCDTGRVPLTFRLS